MTVFCILHSAFCIASEPLTLPLITPRQATLDYYLGVPSRPAQFCANHDQHPAFAICMACRKTICQECASQWDGIHYCVDCLRSLRTAAQSRTRWYHWAGALVTLALLIFVAARVMVWSGALLAGIF